MVITDVSLAQEGNSPPDLRSTFEQASQPKSSLILSGHADHFYFLKKIFCKSLETPATPRSVENAKICPQCSLWLLIPVFCLPGKN